MSLKIDQVYTDNPFVDIIVYNAKLLGINTVLKMKDVADNNETAESLHNAEMYFACMEGTYIWSLFDEFSENVLRQSGLTGAVLVEAMVDKETIPMNMRKTVMDNAALEFIENYEELNNYYRMLYGLPPVGYTNIYVDTDWTPPEGVDIDLTIPVHEMNEDTIYILDQNGVLDDMYSLDPENRGYLRYLDKKISPYAARKAASFYPIYVPTIDSTELSDEYKDRLEINRKYAISTIYSNAYKYESDYYDNFIAVFIILNTMIDMISRVQEFIARKEVIDLRTCRYIFEANGVPFYPEIPLRYQIRLVKNLHQLLKYKSTAKCMVDICSLFGFENITVFKYYLLRIRKKGTTDTEFSLTGDPGQDYELKFVKIPVDEPMDEYIRNPQYYSDYDEITAGDPTWDGGLDHESVKLEHQKLKYNYTRTKYMSVDSIYDLAKIAIQQSYFFNMLYDNVEVEKLINVSVPIISTNPINVCDLFTFLTVLTYKYYGIQDRILDTASKVLYVYGFNFHANASELATQLANMGTIRKQMGRSANLTWTQDDTAKKALQDFIIPEGQIPSFNQMMNIFTNNLDIRDVLTDGMRNADNKRVYEMFKLLYDSLMVMELTFDHFADPETGELYRDEEGNATYTEYLKNRNPILYYKIVEIDLIDDHDTKLQQIGNIIDSAVFALEEYIDTEKFSGIFHQYPVVSVEAIKDYIKMVIDFFKSYKVHFLGVNTVYVYSDKWDGWIKIIDDIVEKKIMYWKTDVVDIIDQIVKQSNVMTLKEMIDIEERVMLDISTWRYIDIPDKYNIIDFLQFLMRFNVKDTISIDSVCYMNSSFVYDEKIPIIDIREGINVKFTISDFVKINDSMYQYNSKVATAMTGYTISEVFIEKNSTTKMSINFADLGASVNEIVSIVSKDFAIDGTIKDLETAFINRISITNVEIVDKTITITVSNASTEYDWIGNIILLIVFIPEY